MLWDMDLRPEVLIWGILSCLYLVTKPCHTISNIMSDPHS